MSLDIEKELETAGSILQNYHFIYKEGDHGPHYINPDPFLADMELVAAMVDDMLEPFLGKSRDPQVWIDVISGPPIGGLILATVAAATWTDEADDWFELVCPDKVDDGFAFTRATFAERLKGKNVLVLEDFINSGGSTAKVCRLIEAAGGTVVGVSAVCNRGGATKESLGVPRLEALLNVRFEQFPAEDCPLCKAEVPIVLDIGHGARFRKEHPDFKIEYVTLLS